MPWIDKKSSKANQTTFEYNTLVAVQNICKTLGKPISKYGKPKARDR